MALEIDLNNFSDTTKALLNGVPFAAGMVKDIETPYYTKLLQTIITFIVVGLIGWSANLVISDKENDQLVLNQLTLINAKLEFMQSTVIENKAEINILKNSTKDRVYRPEWQEKYKEQDERLLHLERVVR